MKYLRSIYVSLAHPNRVVVYRSRSQTRRAMTLLELLVVLVILTIVATIAVSSMQPRVESARFDQTRKTLEEISNATIGVRNGRQVDGTPLISGFVADIGRAPKMLKFATPSISNEKSDEQSGSNLDQNKELSELWDLQSPLTVEFPFRFRPGPKSPVDLSDVQIPCGWRGPYLHLPGGFASQLDGWGKPFEYVPDSNGQISFLRWNPTGTSSEPIVADLTIGKVFVGGSIYADQPLPANLQVVLLTPDPESSRTELSVRADEQSTAESFKFSDVPVGLRAICVLVDDRRVSTIYVQVPHEGLSLVIDLSGKFAASDE